MTSGKPGDKNESTGASAVEPSDGARSRSIRVRLATAFTDTLVPIVFPRINWFFRWLLASRLHWLASWYVIVIIVPGRRTGRIYRVPIAFHRTDPVTLESLTSPRGRWWKNLRGITEVAVLHRGRTLVAGVEVVERDLAAISRALGKRDFCRRFLTPLPPEQSILIRLTLRPGSER